MVTPGGLSLDLSKLMILKFVDSLWVCAALGNMLTSIVSRVHFVGVAVHLHWPWSEWGDGKQPDLGNKGQARGRAHPPNNVLVVHRS